TGDVAVMWWTLGIGVVLKGRVIEAIVVDRSPLRALIGLPKGLLGLYGLTGFISDFLSYTRLAALGLASLLVGQVMNILATMVSGAPWGIGLVAATLILVVGHAFNIVINLLGAFVHPARLQFVEFFGKFYEAGGRAYAPFSRRTTSLVLHPAAGEQEGGTHS
ncbi:MAG: V-type ATPase 116kDa subunit family protein, partial [Actinomycetota bacterium]|nr:V-type ATPase 116kDa subunit family protein [Actinomycetota bacterium]